VGWASFFGGVAIVLILVEHLADLLTEEGTAHVFFGPTRRSSFLFFLGSLDCVCACASVALPRSKCTIADLRVSRRVRFP